MESTISENNKTLMKDSNKDTSKLKSIGELLVKFIFITIGAVIMAYGLEAILLPNNIIDGGVTGISMLLGHITSLNLSIFLVLLNLPFFFLGYKQIGKTFAICMLYGIVVLSIATTFLHSVHPFVTDHLLATVFGGIILGIGVGLAIRNGGVLDGTETLAILLEKKLPLSLGQIVMIFNVIIFTVAAFVFGVENALYSMMTYYIASKVIDLVVGGFNEMRSVHIISNNSDELASAISNRLGRGVTMLNGSGHYSGEAKDVIFCAISRLEESKMREIIKHYDPKAFVIITEVSDVKGGRFKKNDIH
jgi:uncharacterized membrane-anchored protein YitT (DUF2179 family)